MDDRLPILNMPDWLSGLSEESIQRDPLPLDELLTDSFYYPAAGTDGRPVQYFCGNYYSFIYVDYGISREELIDRLNARGFRGYQVMASRPVGEGELGTRAWQPSMPRREDGDPQQYARWIKPPYCEWIIFERSRDVPESHGPARFSLLFLCADGVAAYQALYVSNQRTAAGLAIIQPGTAFGLNWTDFCDESKILARTVLGNPAGTPGVLLHGGRGKRSFYDRPCWSYYSKPLGFLKDSNIALWEHA